MPIAAWCTECGANVWVGPDGRCQNGHAAESLLHEYESSPLPATPLPPQASDSSPRPVRPHRWIWTLVAAACVIAIGLVGVSALAISSAAKSAVSIAAKRPTPARPTAADDAFVRGEYPEYEVLDSISYDPAQSLSGLSSVRYLLRATNGGFPRTLDVELSHGKLVDLDSSVRADYLQTGAYVSDDAAFSTTARKTNLLSDEDLASMGRTFDAAKVGANPVITAATYDTQDQGITFLAAAGASPRPSLEDDALSDTHVVQIYRDSPDAPWDPAEVSRTNQ